VTVAQEEMHGWSAAEGAGRKVDQGVDTRERQETWGREAQEQVWVPLKG
jgi:hypothetical protein